jgi:tRNA A22 N-methylase
MMGRNRSIAMIHYCILARSVAAAASSRFAPVQRGAFAKHQLSQAAFSHLPSNQPPTRRKISTTSVGHRHQNRYERFRTCLKAKLKPSNSQHGFQDLMAVAKTTMEMLSSSRRSFNRTWARMSPLIELVVLASMQDDERVVNSKTNAHPKAMRSIADIGCDHGLLTLSLASIAWSASQSFDASTDRECLSRVTGSDISSNALSNAILSLDKANESLSRRATSDGSDKIDALGSIKLPIDFRVGNGLSTMRPGEADGVILSGMGVHTMIEILRNNELDSLGTNYLFLQPTNSRPRHLLMLYDALQNNGHHWRLRDEKIVFLGGRWYINSFFQRGQAYETATTHFPGDFLSNDDIMSRTTCESYVTHHINWLRQDYKNKAQLEKDDERWLNHICKGNVNADRNDACEWYRSNAIYE